VLRVATWNVNSIKARIGSALPWLKESAPDVVLLQETKTLADDFPRLEIEDAGYNLAVIGQKTYNGVAILSKHPLIVEAERLPGDDGDEQARYVEALVEVRRPKRSLVLRVASVYAPNGNPIDSDKFAYKLAWLDRLGAHLRRLLAHEEPMVIGGDYNVAPADEDVYDPEAWADDALCRPESRAKFRAVLHLGFTDAVRALNAGPRLYTYWDYQGNRFARDEGLRIDHLLLSPQAADRLKASGIDRGPRGRDRPSDHTPAWCELDL